MYRPSEQASLDSVEQLREHVRRELREVSRSMVETTELELRPRMQVPDRPREGMIIYADGTSWNPGKGEGPYVYKNAGWRKLSEERESLYADRTYYVRSDGSDSNNGLADTAGGAFLTIQHALDVVGELDIGIHNVTVQVQDGTWTEALTLRQPIGAGTSTLKGNTSTPTNCVLHRTGGHLLQGSFISRYNIKGFQVKTTTSGDAIRLTTCHDIQLYNMDFGATVGEHIFAWNSTISIMTDYTISGGANVHWRAANNGIITCSVRTVTLTGTPAFVFFAYIYQASGADCGGCTFSGAATGTRYGVSLNGWINTYGGGATYLPGNAAGSAASGGQYV